MLEISERDIVKLVETQFFFNLIALVYVDK